jgi:ankyrin repeat protein
MEYRFMACNMLLKAGATGNGVNEALIISVSEDSSNTSFLKILIPNANVNHSGGLALSEAIKRRHTKHVSLLLEQHSRLNATSFTNAFDAALAFPEPAEELKYCRIILEASPPEISTSVVLLKIVRMGNENLCTLFLQHKADLNHDGGICLVSAVHAQNIKILTLLVESTNPKPSKNSLEAAFNAAFGTTDKTCRLAMIQILLDAGVNGDRLNSALVNQAKGGDANIALCSMLLKYGASIDAQNGAPLVVATKLRAILLLQTMLQDRKAAYGSLSRSVAPLFSKFRAQSLGARISKFIQCNENSKY